MRQRQQTGDRQQVGHTVLVVCSLVVWAAFSALAAQQHTARRAEHTRTSRCWNRCSWESEATTETTHNQSARPTTTKC